MGHGQPHPEGTVLNGKFRIVRVLGEGGMGVVYEIEHLLTHHRRALKLLHTSSQEAPEVAERFLREASAAGRIGDPHIVETFDAGELNTGEPYLVMEMLQGQPLSTLLETRKRLELGLLADLLCQTAETIQSAHQAGIVHRDLKPDNLFVVEREGRPFVKILDFGISKFAQNLTGGLGVQTREGSMLGTPFYMAPEQMMGAKDVDGRVDVWSLGVILYEAAAGVRPFLADSLPELAVILTQAQARPLPELRPDLPPAFCTLVHRALQRDRAQRLSSAGELAEGLRPFAGAPGSVPAAPSPPPHASGAVSAQSQPAGGSSNAAVLTTTVPHQLDGPLSPQPKRQVGLWVGLGGVLACVAGVGLLTLRARTEQRVPIAAPALSPAGSVSSSAVPETPAASVSAAPAASSAAIAASVPTPISAQVPPATAKTGKSQAPPTTQKSPPPTTTGAPGKRAGAAGLTENPL